MIYDFHNDIITFSRALTSIKTEIENNEANGINTIYAIFTSKLKEPLNYCLAAKKFVPNGRFAIEDMGFVTPQNIDKLLGLAPVYCGLTWNYDNYLAGGAFDNGALTRAGEQMIRRLDENKICIDTAHLNKKSFWKVMECNPRKVICSHTAMDFVNRHPRNLTKEQICAIIMQRGVVGISFVSSFLTQKAKAEIDDLCEHIVAFIDNFGADALVLGTDFYGTDCGVNGINSYSDLEKLKTALKTRGLDEQTIQKIFYLNAIKFWST